MDLRLKIYRKWHNWSIDQRLNAELKEAGIEPAVPSDFVGIPLLERRFAAISSKVDLRKWHNWAKAQS